MDYRKERGVVGKWKECPVHIVEAANYQNKNDDIIYVIADDGMKMVKNGEVIGTLSASGSVNSVKSYKYNAFKPTKLPDEEWKGKRREIAMDDAAEISLETTIPPGYFEQYAVTVNKFFEDLNK